MTRVLEATGQPTVRKQRDKWTVCIDGIDTATCKERPRQIGTYASVSAAEHVSTDEVCGGEVDSVICSKAVLGGEVAGQSHEVFIDFNDRKLRPQNFESAI